MTERLYYDDAYLWQFDAAVTSVKNGKRPGEGEVTLDRSAFYPTSGGQPFDTGTLCFGNETARVTDVEVDREGIVWHRTDRRIQPGTAVRGRIDGDRRTDHMEQHGGEHMLAGAIWEKMKGVTIGLHLGAEDSSIDVTLPEGRTHLTEEELSTLPLRKAPTVTEHVRIVAMGDFEMVACGGTHPSSTGRIGLLKIISAIPAKGKTRVSFVCGGRAARLFRTYMRCADKAGAALSCPPEKLSVAAAELKYRLSEAEKRANKLETREILKQMEEAGEDLKGLTLCVMILPETDGRAVTAAVSEYIGAAGRIILLAAGERLTFARSADVKADMNELIKRVARGGGRPDMASGAGIPECVSVARKILMTEGISK